MPGPSNIIETPSWPAFLQTPEAGDGASAPGLKAAFLQPAANRLGYLGLFAGIVGAYGSALDPAVGGNYQTSTSTSFADYAPAVITVPNCVIGDVLLAFYNLALFNPSGDVGELEFGVLRPSAAWDTCINLQVPGSSTNAGTAMQNYSHLWTVVGAGSHDVKARFKRASGAGAGVQAFGGINVFHIRPAPAP